MRRTVLGGLCLIALVVVGLPALLGRLTATPVVARPPSISAEVDTTRSVDAMISIRVYFPDRRVVQEMPLDEYLKGVVAGEMPSDFETEALRAQMVVARTYALRRVRPYGGEAATGCPLSPQADVCADPNTGQAFLSRDQANAKLGMSAAASLWRRLDDVQKATDGLIVRYKGQLIDPLYHSVSGTFTEDAADYYGNPVPYLKSADDHWGEDAPKLNATVTFSPEDLVRKLSGGGKEIAVAAVAGPVRNGNLPITITARTPTNRVKTVTVAGTLFSGKEFRERLNLRSTDFSVAVKQGTIIINTHGYGHGVGMSQYGANGMAKAGKGFRDILTHYYEGVTVVSLFGE